MLLLTLWLSTAAGAEAVPYLSPTLPLGEALDGGVQLGDFDGDGVVDLIYLSTRAGGGTLGFAGSSAGTHGFDLPQPVTDARLDRAPGPGHDRLLLSLPFAGGDPPGGVTSLRDLPRWIGTPATLGLVSELRGATGAQAGQGHAIADVGADGAFDLISAGSEPSDPITWGVVYAAPATDGGSFDAADAPFSWRGGPVLPSFGAALAVVDGQLAVASCERAGDACLGEAALVRLDPATAAGTEQEVPLNQAVGVGAIVGWPAHLLPLPDQDGDGDGELTWADATQVLVLDLEGAITGQITRTGPQLAVHTHTGGLQLWVQDGGAVHLLEQLGFDSAANLATETWTVPGESLGVRLAAGYDLTGDGCPDAVALSDAGTTVYLLAAPCAVLDTDTPDSDTPDTDTPDSDTPDSDLPDADCEPRFGWSCQHPGPGTSALLGLITLAALRRRARRSPR
jgi:uncharacterized protein (TIGR03382 family)